MADAPSWSYPISPAARWVLASGLPTRLTPPTETLDTTSYATLADEARRHRIDGLLHTAVADRTLRVDANARAQAGRDELAVVRDRIAYETRVTGVLDLFDQAGIEVRILKGLALARLDYADEMHRRTGDLDVAVHPNRMEDAIRMLVAAGGFWEDPEPTSGWVRHVGKGASINLSNHGVDVDLHRILVWGPFGVRLDPAELWCQARSFNVGGVPRQSLGREEMLLHMCAHLLVLGVTRPTEVRDVAQILCNPDLDTDRLRTLAQRWGVEPILAVAIRFAERELALRAGAHPLGSWAACFNVSARDRLWLRSGATRQRIHGVEQLGVLIELGFGRRPGRWQARRILLRANFAPAPDTYGNPLARLRMLTRRQH